MQYVFRSLDRGDTWERISPDLTTNDPATRGDIRYQTLFTISESPLKYGLIYAGTDDGRLWVTKDGGKAWPEITAGLAPGKWMSRVVASAYELGTVYLTQNGKRDDDFTPYVWKSTDYGKTWTSLAKGIPVGPVNVIREDPVNENILYVGTDMGVYVTTDGGKTWMVLGGEPADGLRPRPDHPPARQHHRHRHARPRHVGPRRRTRSTTSRPGDGSISRTEIGDRPGRWPSRGGRPGPIVLDGVGPVLFEKSRRARRISLTVRASRGVRVAVPWRVSFDEARRVALAKLAWIRRTLARLERARGRCREAVVAAEGLDRRAARAVLAGRLDALAREHGFSPGRLSVRVPGHALGQRLPLRPHPAQRVPRRRAAGPGRLRHPPRARPHPRPRATAGPSGPSSSAACRTPGAARPASGNIRWLCSELSPAADGDGRRVDRPRAYGMIPYCRAARSRRLSRPLPGEAPSGTDALERKERGPWGTVFQKKGHSFRSWSWPDSPCSKHGTNPGEGRQGATIPPPGRSASQSDTRDEDSVVRRLGLRLKHFRSIGDLESAARIFAQLFPTDAADDPAIAAQDRRVLPFEPDRRRRRVCQGVSPGAKERAPSSSPRSTRRTRPPTSGARTPGI